MELHSYAKHRAVKKWSLEQKRRLVEARIHCDEIFKSMPKTSLMPWKKVIMQGKLDDFNAVFVRKQWANMVAKYMQYKQDRLGNKPTHDIDVETVKKVTQEWEFFQPIHHYMTRKTTNLHSYASKKQNDDDTPERGYDQSPSSKSEDLTMKQPTTSTSSEVLNVCSTDTNEDSVISELPSSSRTNTDHDFYSKKFKREHRYFAAFEDDTLESLPADVTSEPVLNEADILHSQEFVVNGSQVYETKHLDHEQVVQHADIKQESPEEVVPDSRAQQKALSTERDRYYRHKRRYNHRMERRFDAILNVIGQIAKAEYPNIDTTPMTDIGNSLKKCFLNSSSEEDNNDGNS